MLDLHQSTVSPTVTYLTQQMAFVFIMLNGHHYREEGKMRSGGLQVLAYRYALARVDFAVLFGIVSSWLPLHLSDCN